MKEHWYENDWVLSLLSGLTMLVTVVVNYYYHGGHIQW